MDEAHLGYPLKDTEVKVRNYTGFTICFSVDEAHLGYPLKDTEVKVCDDKGKTITEGIGRIYIGNFFLLASYFFVY